MCQVNHRQLPIYLIEFYLNENLLKPLLIIGVVFIVITRGWGFSKVVGGWVKN